MYQWVFLLTVRCFIPLFLQYRVQKIRSEFLFDRKAYKSWDRRYFSQQVRGGGTYLYFPP